MISTTDTVVVFGAEGFIGKHLVGRIRKTGRKIIAVSRHPADNIQDDIKYVTIESGNPEHITKYLKDCSAVIWLASVSTPGSSAGKPLEELHGNLQPLLTLLQNMQYRKGCKLIYISSGGTLYGDVSGEDATEVMPLHPKSYYGAGKAAAEHFISAWSHQYRRTAIIIRPSNIYGPGQTQRKGFGIIPTVFEKIKEDQPVVIWGDGKAIRDYLYIDDFSSLCIKAFENETFTGTHILNAASGQGTTLNQLLGIIQEVTGKAFKRIYDRGRTVDVRQIVLDNSSAIKSCDWLPKNALPDGLHQTWSWFTNQHK